MERIDQEAFEERIKDDVARWSVSIEVDQVEPFYCTWAGFFRIRAGFVEAAEAFHGSLDLHPALGTVFQIGPGRNLGREVDLAADETYLRVYMAGDRLSIGYANFYRALKGFSPFLEDSRFFIYDWASTSCWVDEYTIREGQLCFWRDSQGDSLLDYYRQRAQGDPEDRAFKKFLARMLLLHAESILEEDAGGAQDALAVLREAYECDPDNPDIAVQIANCGRLGGPGG